MKRSIILTILAALLVVGAPVASAAGGLSGTYKTKVAGAPWAIKFSHGNYKVSAGGTAVVRGKYTTSGNQLTMKDSGGKLACGPTGHYTYKFSGGKLKFKNTGDKSKACTGRAMVLSGTFTKA